MATNQPSVRSVGIIANDQKPHALELRTAVIRHLALRGVDTVTPPDGEPPARSLDGVDLIVTLGGDGTILGAAQIAAPRGIPVLGVHLGRFGFIAETQPHEVFDHLDAAIAGQMMVEERMMLAAQVERDHAAVHRSLGLNDIVINKGSMARMLNLRTEFRTGGALVYPADGVVIATPTGSSAYALSAGGPLIAPTVAALVVVPVCAHTLAARPLVVPCDEEITVTVEAGSGAAICTADSIDAFPLHADDTIRVGMAECRLRVGVFRSGGFYSKIRERLLWGERVNA